MKIEFRCSNCNALLESDSKLAGTAIVCQNCDKREIVPCLFASVISSNDNGAILPTCPVRKHISLFLTALLYNLASPKTIFKPLLLKNKVQQRYKSNLRAYLYETIYRNRLEKFSRNSLAFINDQ